MEILLAIGAAVTYGVSDFTGGALTRRGDVVVVILLSQLVSSAYWSSSWPPRPRPCRGPGSAGEPRITRAPGPPATETGVPRHTAILYALGAGVGFGAFFILLERSPADSGLWPLLGTRIFVVAALGLVLAARHLAPRTPSRMGAGLLGLGVLNTLADLLFLLATRRGLLSLVAVITSMYPAATVAFAARILRERIAAQQLAGLAIAAVSVALIASG